MSSRLDPADERQLGVELFNMVWALLGRDDRTAAEDEAMMHAAHASRHHWGLVGTPANLARGEWQCARVYATLGRAEPALYHAHRCLTLVNEGGEGFEDWDRPAALEALARATLVAGDPSTARAHALAAREALRAVADPEDSAVVASDLCALGLD